MNPMIMYYHNMERLEQFVYTNKITECRERIEELYSEYKNKSIDSNRLRYEINEIYYILKEMRSESVLNYMEKMYISETINIITTILREIGHI